MEVIDVIVNNVCFAPAVVGVGLIIFASITCVAWDIYSMIFRKIKRVME